MCPFEIPYPMWVVKGTHWSPMSGLEGKVHPAMKRHATKIRDEPRRGHLFWGMGSEPLSTIPLSYVYIINLHRPTLLFKAILILSKLIS